MRRTAFALTCAAVIAVGVAFLWSGGTPADGPLDDGGGLVPSASVEIDQVVSVGHIALSNYGKEAAAVERVRLLGVTGPLELLGMRTRLFPDPKGTFLSTYGFPPPEYETRPLSEGNVVAVPKEFSPEGDPVDALQLVIGVRATAPGVARASDVEVTYTVGESRYREVFLNPFYLCAPKAEWGDGSGCPPRELEEQFDGRVLEAR